MLAPRILAMLAFISVSTVIAAPIAGDGLVDKRDASPADFGDYGNYGDYGKPQD